MKKNLIKIVSFLSVLAMVCCCMSACGKGGSSNKKSAGKGSDDRVVDLNGYEFVFTSAWYKTEYDDSMTGKEKLFWERKAEVEKKYNCKITMNSFYPDMSAVQAKIMAGEKIGDVVHMLYSQWLPASQAGYIVPLDEVDGLDTTDPRWLQSNTKSQFRNHIWAMSYDRPVEIGNVMFYNENILKSCGVTDNIFKLIKSGDWTFDKFREICKKCTKDTDGDGKFDIYGLTPMEQTTTAKCFMINNNGLLCTEQKDGKVLTTYNSSNVLSGLNFFNKLVNEDKVVKIFDNWRSQETWNDAVSSDNIIGMFTNGKSAFLSANFWVGNQLIKPDSDGISYRLAPYPKATKEDDYKVYTPTSSGFCITSTNKDIDKTVLIWNALAKPAEGEEDYSWAYDEVQKDWFQDDDTESIETYKMLLKKSASDLGDGVQKLTFDFNLAVVASSIFWQTTTPAAALDSIDGIYQASVDSIFNTKNKKQ